MRFKITNKLKECNPSFVQWCIVAPSVRWTIVTIAVIANVALFIGATIFMASGQSFEQFQGM